MNIKIKNKKIYIEEVCIIMLMLCILSPTLRNYLASYYFCFLFITFHELAHMLFASIYGLEILSIKIRTSGLCISISKRISNVSGILVYLAGPLSNILLALLFKKIKFVYEINLALALINLFPIYPLDGFNILKILIYKIVNKNNAQKIIKNIQVICIIFLTILAVIFFTLFKNISLAVMLVYIYMLGASNTGKY